MDRSELKRKAKESLKGKYGDAITLMIISFGISFAAGLIIGFCGLDENITKFISSIVSIIISGLIGFGIVSYFLKVSRNENVTYKELFSETNMFWSYIGIALLVGLFTMLWSLLFIIPGIIAALSYSLVYCIKLDNPELDVKEVLTKSKQMMNGHKWEYFVLILSFLGWIILGIFTFGVLYLWLIPYMQVTLCNFYNNLKKD